MPKYKSQGPRNPKSGHPRSIPKGGDGRAGFGSQRADSQRDGGFKDSGSKGGGFKARGSKDRPRKSDEAPARAGADRAKFKPHEQKKHGKPYGAPRDSGPRPHNERTQPEHTRPDRPKMNRAPEQRSERPQTKLPLTASSPTRQQGPKPERAQTAHAKNEKYSARPRPESQSADTQGESREGRARRVSETWIYGHHPVAAVLANGDRKILRVLATTEALAKLNEESSIPPRTLGQVKAASRNEIDNHVGEGAVHQGVAVLTHPLEHDLQDVLERIAVNPNSCIVVLDQVTDPHNVGAILRSAVAFGAAAVVAPDRNAPDESGAMAKSASGALDKIPYIKAGNLVRALELIKEHQFWLVGLDAEAPQQLADIKLDGRIALVLGAEGEGLRRLVRETCDHVASLPMAGNMESLNVSNATAVALYERARQTKTNR